MDSNHPLRQACQCLKRLNSLTVLGQRIRAARKAKGLTQESLALEAEIDRSYVGQIERGEQNATVMTLARVARVIGCDVAAFCHGLPLPKEHLRGRSS